MKWMGGWSYQDFLDCPGDLLPVIVGLMEKEADRNRRNARGR